MPAFITNIINNVFHMIWFCSIVAEPKHSRKKNVLIVAMTTVFVELISAGLLRVWRAGFLSDARLPIIWKYLAGYLIVMISYTVMFVFFVSASHPAKSLFLVAAYFTLWTMIYGIVSIVTDTYAGAGDVLIWGLRIGLNLIFLIPYLSLFRKRLFQMYKEIKSGYWFISTFAVMCFFMQSLFLFYNQWIQSHQSAFVVLMAFSMAFMVAVYAMVFQYMSQSGHAHRMKQMEANEKLLLAQIDSYEKIAENARQTRHDFRHHNMIVMEYARNRDYQGILNYLQEYEDKETEKYVGAFCKNHAVNTVLSAYVNRCKQSDISVDMDIHLSEMLDVSDYDLVTMLANVLENAVNGCMHAEGGRRIDFSFRQKGGKLILVCRNACMRDIHFEDGLPRNPDRESIGVESIINTIARYGGNADFSASDGQFVCRLIFNDKKPEAGLHNYIQ